MRQKCSEAVPERRTALYNFKAIISDSSQATTADGMYCFVDVSQIKSTVL